MAERTVMEAETRSGAGTGAARAVRRTGKVPGIVYGPECENVKIALPGRALEREAQRPGFFAQLFELKVDGRSMDVLARDLQLHPVTDAILHVDFLAVKAGATVAVAVPVVFVNEEACEGLRRGGVLNVVRHEVELYCPADAIPEALTVDLAGLDIGASIHIGAIALPEGVTPVIDDRDFTVATVAAPTVAADVVEAEEEETVEAVEGADEES